MLIYRVSFGISAIDHMARLCINDRHESQSLGAPTEDAEVCGANNSVDKN
jgi:hypothetical protein